MRRYHVPGYARAVSGPAKRPVPAAAAWAEPMFTFGVTGTNGKTSTTRLIAAALRAAGHSTLEIGTLGVRLDDEVVRRGKSFSDFLATMQYAASRGCRHAAIELTSVGLADGYARVWRCDLGVFTNLSPDHLQTHGTWENYLAAKAQLFVHLGPGRTAVLNAGDPHALFLDQAIPADVERRWFHAPGRGERLHPADLAAAQVEVSIAGTRVQLEPSPAAEALGGMLEVAMIGEVFAENALAAALAALTYGVPAEAILRGFATCPTVPGRFELASREPSVPNMPIVAIDYAHSPDALFHTCATARRLAGEHAVIVVFGAGGNSTPEKREPMGEVVGAHADLAIVTSDNPRDEDPQAIAAMLLAGLQRGGRSRVLVELDRERAIATALEQANAGDVIVIAGKGHEQGQVVRGQTSPFSDLAVARRLLGPRA
jgi:UDP-N-acetylmuramoyl-L-alanyl-D-glutamate--2,6-diaminopimelate ligase